MQSTFKFRKKFMALVLYERELITHKGRKPKDIRPVKQVII